MTMHRLKRILGPAEQASKPGHDLLPLEPLTQSRILGTADVLDHREIATRLAPVTDAPRSARPLMVLAPGREVIAVPEESYEITGRLAGGLAAFGDALSISATQAQCQRDSVVSVVMVRPELAPLPD